MFPVKTYVSRRAELRAKTGGGLILLPGNQPSANNYPNNAYYFRQDSTFLYYFGLDRPSLAGVIDADTGEEVLSATISPSTTSSGRGRSPRCAKKAPARASPTAARWRHWPTIWPPRSGSAAAYTTCRPTAAKRSCNSRRCWGSLLRCCTTTSRST